MMLRCILSKFYIKPQHWEECPFYLWVVSYRNSTSNHNTPLYSYWVQQVVSYRNSTSNHNSSTYGSTRKSVVSYRNSTSNHNRYAPVINSRPVVSYRNSTSNHNLKMLPPMFPALYLIEILHQTTTTSTALLVSRVLYLIEILHQTTTSRYSESSVFWLYLIEILHQTTTQVLAWTLRCRCILSKFYIKPQQQV